MGSVSKNKELDRDRETETQRQRHRERDAHNLGRIKPASKMTACFKVTRKPRSLRGHCASLYITHALSFFVAMASLVASFNGDKGKRGPGRAVNTTSK